ncbi:MAG: hypothetical protein H3C58_04185 [Fimbriimonadaceae bacterium]|nr:hypothetical protein [Fimbriimonadaceae bacterium]
MRHRHAIVGSRLLSLLALAVASASSFGITWCHDYSYYRATEFVRGKGKDLNNLSTVSLKSRLLGLGYRRVAALKPGDGFRFAKGDVVVIGDWAEGQEEDHSAFVTDNAGHMDHLLQKFNSSGVAYKYEDLDKVYDPVMQSLLVRRDWTIQDFHTKKRILNGQELDSPYTTKTFQVYRRDLDPNTVVGVWVLSQPRRAPKRFAPRTDSDNVPICTLKESDLAKGEFTYERVVTPPGGTFTFKVEFTPPPSVIIEGEQVALGAKLTVTPGTQELLGDEMMIFVGGNGKKPETKTHTVYVDTRDLRLTVGLWNSPKSTSKVTNEKGEWVPYNPPTQATLFFNWMEFDPDGFVATRDVMVSHSYFERIQYHYVRKEMTLQEAAALKYPD